MKYIIVRTPEGEEMPLVFPDKVMHKSVARCHRCVDGPHGLFVVSAGFWNGVSAYGESESIPMKSRPQDTAILAAHFGCGMCAQRKQWAASALEHGLSPYVSEPRKPVE